MKSSPGHQEHPDHQVREERLRQVIHAEVDGEAIAESDDVIKVDEDGNEDRYYFPRADVQMDRLQSSEKTTRCPFKGEGRYFHVRMGGQTIEDAAWSYESPYREHQDLKDRIAFHGHENPSIEITPRA